jgi:threonine dehydrogenase-like Zn-dependent dehydrogenase
MKAIVMRAEPARYALLQALRPLSARLCYSGPLASVSLQDVPEPALPSPEWVIVRTALCGFCGSDLNLILMKDSPTAMPFTSFPCVPGHELCGEIVETGSEAGGWKTGDRVALCPLLPCRARDIEPPCRSCKQGLTAHCENFAEGKLAPGMFTGICSSVGGGFAPYVAAHRSQLFRIPSGLSFRSAVLTEPLAVSLQAVLDNRPDVSDSVLVIGGGVIGLFIVKVLRALDAACGITVADPSPLAANYALAAGADAVIRSDLIEAARQVTGARVYRPLMGGPVVMGGFTRIYDTVASEQTLVTALRILAAGGTLSVLGIGKRVKLDLTHLWLKGQTVKGCFAYGEKNDGKKSSSVFAQALDMLASGTIQAEDMLTHEFALENFREMIEVNLLKSKHRAMKTALSFV